MQTEELLEKRNKFFDQIKEIYKEIDKIDEEFKTLNIPPKKVAYNDGYGGFGSVSEKAYQRLLELGDKSKFTETNDANFGNEPGKIIYEYDSTFGRLCRENPLLIQVIEELGEEANTKYCRYKIKEIPFQMLYVIHEYDGMESVNQAPYKSI